MLGLNEAGPMEHFGQVHTGALYEWSVYVRTDIDSDYINEGFAKFGRGLLFV